MKTHNRRLMCGIDARSSVGTTSYAVLLIGQAKAVRRGMVHLVDLTFQRFPRNSTRRDSDRLGPRARMQGCPTPTSLSLPLSKIMRA